MSPPTSGGRANQKARTRKAILDACRDLIRQGRPVVMPDVARAALVSEATAYRYFPDMASLLREALTEERSSPAEALAPVADSRDPVERVAFAARVLLTAVAEKQAVVRAMIASTIVRPELAAAARPALRFGLIDEALRPLTDELGGPLTQLRRDLSIVVSAEALFSLTDLYNLPPAEAIDSAVETAKTLTASAVARARQPSSGRGRPGGTDR